MRFVLPYCLALLFLMVLVYGQTNNFNQSLCADIDINNLHFFINDKLNDQDIKVTKGNKQITYNLCKNVEVYCPYQNAVLMASMVIVNDATRQCISLEQNNVDYYANNSAVSGLTVTYTSLNSVSPQVIQSNTYPCVNSTGKNCPAVEAGTIWEYFNEDVITYTIILEVIGVILMTLGIYIYRGSIILIGWGTSLMILVLIESLFVFQRGVPASILQNVLILSVVTSFFVGYMLGYFPKAGIFCMGMWIGIIVTLTLNNICFYYINSNPSTLVLMIVLPVLSLVFGIVILFIKKTFIIFASSLIGSYFCLRALSWSLGAFPNQFLFSKQYHNGLATMVQWQFYLYVIALLILTASSSALQAWLFKKKMAKTHQDDDLDKHLNNMENKLKREREQMIEIKSVFKSEESVPKVLSKAKGRQERGYSRGSQSEQGQQLDQRESASDSIPPYQDSDEDDDSPRVAADARKALNEKLLKGNTSKR